ncbi:MAG: hypothetical protein REH79_03025 [Spiroplasma sp.]|nr:hypothetical protein [Spiroplasma sp.]
MAKKIKKIKKWFKKEKNEDINFFIAEEDNNKTEQEKTKKPHYSKLEKKYRKSRNILFNFRRRKTIQIIKFLENKNIFNGFFYTDVHNITLMLEQGIKPTSEIKLSPKQQYVVWTYLEHATYLELELGNTTRHYFWKWCSEQNVQLNNIAIISVNLNKLFETTFDEWGLNLETNRIQVYERIPLNAIDWILVKDRRIFKLARTHIIGKNLKVKIFQGNAGEIIS